MSQQVLTFAGSPLSGAAMIAALETKLQSLASSRSGTSRPSDIVAGEEWLDTTTATAWLVKRWDGVDDITIMTINTTANTVTFAGTATSGANSNITSLSGLTTPLSVAQGGTASATAADARVALDLEIGVDVQAYDADTMKSDTAASITAPHAYTPVAMTKTSSTIDVDMAVHMRGTRTLNGNETLGAPSNCAAGREMILAITGHGTDTLGYNAAYKAKAGESLPAAPADGKTMRLAFIGIDNTNVQYIGKVTSV